MMFWVDHAQILCFFFSSRRRHTRYWRDWSSDVCSSDLHRSFNDVLQLADISRPWIRAAQFERILVDFANLLPGFLRVAFNEVLQQHRNEIGRASCRERV